MIWWVYDIVGERGSCRTTDPRYGARPCIVLCKIACSGQLQCCFLPSQVLTDEHKYLPQELTYFISRETCTFF